MIKSESCYAVVEISFFPEDPKTISEFWIFAADKRILGRGIFEVYLSADMQLAFEAELRRCL